jgi:hypothetical protein
MTETAENKANRVVAGLVVAGGLIGALVGVAASRLFIRADQQALTRHQQRGPQGLSLSPLAILPLLIGLVGLVRQIAALGDEQ